MDANGYEWGTDKERRTKENQMVSEFEQAGAGTERRSRGGRDGLMMESKSSVAVIAVLFVVVGGSGDLGHASSAGVGWVGC